MPAFSDTSLVCKRVCSFEFSLSLNKGPSAGATVFSAYRRSMIIAIANSIIVKITKDRDTKRYLFRAFKLAPDGLFPYIGEKERFM